MSDLQCPATVLLTVPAVEGEPLDTAAERLARQLRWTRVAVVYSDGSDAAVRTAASVAALLGVPDRVEAPFPDCLDQVADLHRGETVLVVAEAGPAGEGSGADLGQGLTAEGLVEISVDADGWTVRRWAGGSANRTTSA